MDNSGYYGMSLAYINQLEGFKTFFKNLHWSAYHLTYHKVIDDALNAINEAQDEIAETSQGYLGRQYGVGEVQGVKCACTTPKEGIESLDKETALFYVKIKMDDTLMGVINAVNDFQQEILKLKYLFNLAEKDGSTTPPSGVKGDVGVTGGFKGIVLD